MLNPFELTQKGSELPSLLNDTAAMHLQREFHHGLSELLDDGLCHPDPSVGAFLKWGSPTWMVCFMEKSY